MVARPFQLLFKVKLLNNALVLLAFFLDYLFYFSLNLSDLFVLYFEFLEELITNGNNVVKTPIDADSLVLGICKKNN
jgi:hypothetical protein